MASSDDLIFKFATEGSAKFWYYSYVVLSAFLLGLMITMYILSYDIIDSISNNKVCKYTNEQKLEWQKKECKNDTENVAKKCPPCIKGKQSNQPSNQPSNQLPNQPSNQLSNQPPKNIIENMIVDYGWEECSNLTNNLSTPIKEKNIQLLSVLRYYNIILVLIILYLISASGFIIYFKSKM